MKKKNRGLAKRGYNFIIQIHPARFKHKFLKIAEVIFAALLPAPCNPESVVVVRKVVRVWV